jgi:hypothetical protein
MRTKLFLTSIAALLLATGMAHASSYHAIQCGKKRIYVLGHHGFRSTRSRETKETIKHYLIDGSAKPTTGIFTFTASYVLAFRVTK